MRLPAGVAREDLFDDPVHVLLPARHPAARRHRDAVPLAELEGDAWAAGDAGMGWDEMTHGTCRERGGFTPDVRHRTNDATVAVALVARGLAVTMLPALPLPRRAAGVAVRSIAGGPVSRTVFAATRGADSARPSTRALLGAIRDVAAGLTSGL